MGQLAGIYRFDQRPIDAACRAAALSCFTAPLTQERPGLLMAWDGSCGEAISSDGWCSLDGRVDRLRTPAGSALALRLYGESGAAGLKTLIGDWSLALWDLRRRTLVLASDYAGVRPLYYFQSAECVAWSSSLDHLAGWMDCRRLDMDYVGAFLLSGFPQQLTPYRGIHPVPAGCAVSISSEGTLVAQLWSAPPADSIRYGSDGAYEEQFRDLFQEAVAVRLETGSPV